MNERIKELAEQADKEAFPHGSMAWMEVFAESIVQECASICYNSGLKDPDTHAQNLMFHFNIDNCRNDK